MFGNKKDPLADVVSGIMQDTRKRNAAEQQVNERFGVASRKALPHERVAEYDAALKQAQTDVLKEETIEEAKDDGYSWDTHNYLHGLDTGKIKPKPAFSAHIPARGYFNSEKEYRAISRRESGEHKGVDRKNKAGTLTSIGNKTRNKRSEALKKVFNKSLKEMKDARDRAIEAAQRAEDDKGGMKTGAEWRDYWRKHGDKGWADFSEKASKEKKRLRKSLRSKMAIKEANRNEKAAARDDYANKITGSKEDEAKLKEVKRRLALWGVKPAKKEK